MTANPSEWPRSNGQIDMQTLPLDLDDLLSELPEEVR